MSETRSVGTPRDGAFFWTMLVALLALAFGLPILGGGVYLIWLGGSWYYAIAGFGLVATAIALFAQSMSAFWLYLLTYIGTVIWAFWEVGFDWWAQVPRLVAPTVLFIFILTTLPALARSGR
ncbi:hypothetical protein SAMN06297251_1334 [Fulvimarina manganoxydans]|uniref:Quinoprotein glucose dehydrogenase n=1 Tax=Fulvimarina manganoxydans TaxID=937218 RepID=A0A1W2EUB7_9HYPH|nr:glucose dehydrogenase [Fulvimarina manganoxydans]SMD12768.1 hypothetical protein SAMN06297251_1334 [Fulvimarina manganoxydans]